MSNEPSPVTIDAIYLYPIKSCGGLRVQQAALEHPGFVHDRRWMIVDDTLNFVSQRRAPSMALIDVKLISDDQLEPRLEPTLKLRFLSEDSDPTEELVVSPHESMHNRVEVRVWNDTVEALTHTPKVNAVLSRWLGMNCQLVKLASPRARLRQSKEHPRGFAVSFADSAPVLLANRASAETLGHHHGKTIDILRFRPNIVVSGPHAFAEEEWRTLRAESVSFESASACKRCLMIEIDQTTGQRDEPLMKSLLKVRQVVKADTQLLFGLKLVPTLTGVLREGETLYAQ